MRKTSGKILKKAIVILLSAVLTAGGALPAAAEENIYPAAGSVAGSAAMESNTVSASSVSTAGAEDAKPSAAVQTPEVLPLPGEADLSVPGTEDGAADAEPDVTPAAADPAALDPAAEGTDAQEETDPADVPEETDPAEESEEEEASDEEEEEDLDKEEEVSGQEVGEAIQELIGQVSGLAEMSREEVSELRENITLLQEKYEELPEEAKEVLEEGGRILDKAGNAADIVEQSYAQLESTGQIIVEQTGKANSFRYLDGEPILALAQSAEQETNAAAALEAGEDPVIVEALKEGTITVAQGDASVSYTGGAGAILLTQQSTQSFGVDVSKWQGKIDWAAAQKAGVKFAIIRLGYGDDLASQDDEYWEYNTSECERLGIPYGAYIYSYATDTAHAASEAQHALRLLKGHQLTLPVFYDIEDAVQSALPASAFTSIANTFCSKVAEAGYYTGIYSFLNWFNDKLSGAAANAAYYHWVAQWPSNYSNSSRCSYGGRYEVWQYTSSGTVAGISGNVDCNWWYGDFPAYDEESTIYNGLDYSPVYDYEYYTSHYEDAAQAAEGGKRQAFLHFIYTGMTEGRQACEDFDPLSYYYLYPDLRNAFGTNWARLYRHYITNGIKEKRRGAGITKMVNAKTVYNGVNYAAVYDYNYYTEHNPDVKKAFGLNETLVLRHFVTNGMKEQRRANEEFNVLSYRLLYKDLRRAYGNSWEKYYLHYINNGKREGRIAAGVTQMQNYEVVLDGIDYSAVYDYNYYVLRNPDVRKTFGYNDEGALWHFVTYGMREGRIASKEFHIGIYMKRYLDLQEAFGTDKVRYYMHYIRHGKAEKRSAV